MKLVNSMNDRHGADQAEQTCTIAGALISKLDPLEPDDPADPYLTLTARQLLRLAFVATETALRFEREAIDIDAVAWLCAPRNLFNGSSPLEACGSRTEFLRAMVFHGLSIGLDADAEEIDSLISDQLVDDFDPIAGSSTQGAVSTLVAVSDD